MLKVRWLRRGVYRTKYSVHAFEVASKKDLLEYNGLPRVAVMALCGTKRDPRLIVPMNKRKDKICLRCSAAFERKNKREREYRTALHKFGARR